VQGAGGIMKFFFKTGPSLGVKDDVIRTGIATVETFAFFGEFATSGKNAHGRSFALNVSLAIGDEIFVGNP
jgi:hypothetical protein